VAGTSVKGENMTLATILAISIALIMVIPWFIMRTDRYRNTGDPMNAKWFAKTIMVPLVHLTTIFNIALPWMVNYGDYSISVPDQLKLTAIIGIIALGSIIFVAAQILPDTADKEHERRIGEG
jgi:protein-S-isoprenylcysteine O-methyltransferase Ste14